jgi:hypothetical protein
MSFSLDRAKATIKRVKSDKTAAGEPLDTKLRVELKTGAEILAEFHPALRSALFVKDGGVRFPQMKNIPWEGTRRNVDFSVRPAQELKPAFSLAGVSLRNFHFHAIEEAQQQLVFMRFDVDVPETTTTTVSRLFDYLKEEAWIDINGGGELDLAPPSARTEIPELEQHDRENPATQAAEKARDVIDQAKASASTTPAPPAEVKPADVVAVRRLQLTRKGIQAKLSSYHDEVLRAAIAAETSASDCRPMFIKMLEAELERRHKERKQ